MNKRREPISPLWQPALILSVFAAAAVLVIGKIIYIQNYDQRVLQSRSEPHHVSTVPITTHRKEILDRHGELLATSVPVVAVTADPYYFDHQESSYTKLAQALGMPAKTIHDKINRKRDKRFVYLKRHASLDVGEQVRQLKLPGVGLQREYKRYYPMGEALATIVGLTDVDDNGIEGLEKSFNQIVQGQNGKKLIYRDRQNRTVRDVGYLKIPHQGRQLVLSIDKGLQYKVHQVLKTSVLKNQAESGAAVVLDAGNGEVLALANSPSFNPNDRRSFLLGTHRNRAVIDVFEPGSTVKPFIMAALLEHDLVSLQQSVDTSPGYYRLIDSRKDYMIRDVRNFGVLTIPEVIIKSSNVGISRLVGKLDAEKLWRTFSQLGFGRLAGLSFPGEAKGRLNHYRDWHKTDQTVLSYGYGLSTSALQLAAAYTSFANDGRQLQATIIKRRYTSQAYSQQVFRPEVARAMRAIMQSVVSKHGTAPLAAIPGFTVAGKTGTVYKSGIKGYQTDRYVSLFVGMVPAVEPRLVAAVVIDEPKAGLHYGGQVAAPVFAEMMAYAARVLDIGEDETPTPVEKEPFYTFKNR